MNNQLTICLALLALGSSGCSTVDRLRQWPRTPQVYGGMREDIRLIHSGRAGDAPIPAWLVRSCGVVDLPFSLLADTVVLPVTIASLFAAGPSKDRTDPDDFP